MSSLSKPTPVRILAVSVILFGLFSTLLAPTACVEIRDEGDGRDQNVVIVANGKILTMDAGHPTAPAMAVHEGKIRAVGDLAGYPHGLHNWLLSPLGEGLGPGWFVPGPWMPVG